MKILISGIGLAGPCLAYWLLKHGDGKHEIVMIDKAKKARKEGYIIDLSGNGYEVIQRMGLEKEFKKHQYEIGSIDSVDENGNVQSSLDYGGIVQLMEGNIVSLQRGDIARILFDALPLHKDKTYPEFSEEDKSRIKLLYGTEISMLSMPNNYTDEKNVFVTFSDGTVDNFDLVVGADGTYSNVRNLAFGKGGIKDLNMAIVASEVSISQEQREFITSHSIPRRTCYTYSSRNGTTVALFAVRGNIDRKQIATPRLRKKFVKENFKHMGWKAPEILAGIEQQADVYATQVVQIRLDSWKRPGAVLLGDAAACPSLVSGEGAVLALTGAYVLAHSLNTCQGNLEKALTDYENLIMPLARKRQVEAANNFVLAGFAPKTNIAIKLSPFFVRIFNLKPVIRKFVRDREKANVPLPNY